GCCVIVASSVYGVLLLTGRPLARCRRIEASPGSTGQLALPTGTRLPSVAVATSEAAAPAFFAEIFLAGTFLAGAWLSEASGKPIRSGCGGPKGTDRPARIGRRKSPV